MYKRRLFKQGNSVCLTIPGHTLHKLHLVAGDEVLLSDSPHQFLTVHPIPGPHLPAEPASCHDNGSSLGPRDSSTAPDNPCPECGQLVVIPCITCAKPIFIPEGIRQVLITAEPVNNLPTEEKPPSPFPRPSSDSY